jgi:hypothetical protein
MCEACDEFPPLFIAYFNKAGGKLWRPTRPAPAAGSGAADPYAQASQPTPVAVREFFCEAGAPEPPAREPDCEGAAPAAPSAAAPE